MYPQKPPSSYNQPQHQLQGGEQLTLRMIELAPFGNSSLKRETMVQCFNLVHTFRANDKLTEEVRQ